MKRITLAAIPILLFALMVTGCPDPNAQTTPKDKYAPAYNVVRYGKFVVQTAHSTWKGVAAIKHNDCNDLVCAKLHPDKDSAVYKTCMAQDHSAVAEFQQCYGKLGRADAVIDKAVPLALSLFADVKDIIDLKVAYDVAKESVKLKQDPEALQKFCDTVFPGKTGDEYQKCLAGDEDLAKFNWEATLKGRACTVYYGLAFVPAPYNRYTDPVRIWFRGYGGCR
ncbi:hypothetical protein LCGC14_0698890 [marine sediment metagenome]|uniref:Lipoprotein n=1 Tax=marine sediment metagenome TaxID=412755 RepID=A0A0F9QIG8_9ZZZZ